MSMDQNERPTKFRDVYELLALYLKTCDRVEVERELMQRHAERANQANAEAERLAQHVLTAMEHNDAQSLECLLGTVERCGRVSLRRLAPKHAFECELPPSMALSPSADETEAVAAGDKTFIDLINGAGARDDPRPTLAE